MRERVDKLKKAGNKQANPTKVSPQNADGRQFINDADSASVEKNPETEAEKALLELRSKIFGADLFKNKNQTFEPNLNIATPKGYIFEGLDENGNSALQKVSLAFFNPKFGLFHDLNETQSVYASFGVANKEPNRNDYVESTPNSRPEHETLYDTEIGYKQKGKKLNLGVNIYHMNYKNQLALTGQINDVGAYTHTNIDQSYRKGIELEATYKLTNKITWEGNMTLSQNKIISHTAYIDNWDTCIGRVKIKRP